MYFLFYKEISESVKRFEREDLDSIFGQQSFRWTTNCPLFHWIARNPKYTEKIKNLGMVSENTPIKEYLQITKKKKRINFKDMGIM